MDDNPDLALPAVRIEPKPNTLAARLRAEALPSLRQGVWAGAIVLVIAGVVSLTLFVMVVVSYRFVDPPFTTFTLAQRWVGGKVDQRWVRLDQISQDLIVSVIASEDGQFCTHHGVDFRELTQAVELAARTGEDARGASTISMQVVKNLFLWPGRNYIRKGLEVPMTLLMELILPKRRILEIYLNIAEWGPGIFGAEAGARYHFKKPAARLSEREAALMAVALPNPAKRVAGKPGPGTQRLAGIIERRVHVMGWRAASCIRLVPPA